ncbi:LD-carboxypeptidase [Allosphingosinicella flava]|uniref:LD-carboxypeptidase n=1 Tax=Allosphingosinicella flava TaxID=2771430 RepID=A0A7T2LLD0_9SPHN|nr:LD-carboxypeptidase [Sphingosinicella flava]QPQ54248.1 LD-carboxypeptidase [Sphingosinicella flava]
MRIGIVAPGTPVTREVADRVIAIAAECQPGLTLHFHPQCFLVHNHFAGPDAARADAFVEVANDPAYDALWVARGGYGACRIAEDVLARLEAPARTKAYLGYSDAGYLLAGLYAAGFERVAHGPMPGDIRRAGGEAAIRRALGWLAGDREGIEPHAVPGTPRAAFNITVLSQLLGTPLQPDLSGHLLMLEDVSEYTYRTDRSMFHITANPGIRAVAGIRLGRCSEVPDNDPDFGESEEEVVRHWCARAGIPFLGRADIGHDADNKVVPFGTA